MSSKFNVVVCASGGGGNFQSLIDASLALGIDIVLLIVDRECGAIARAVAHGIPYVHVGASQDDVKFAANFNSAIPYNTQLIILAGFMPIIPKSICEKWTGKLINTHPSLLPKYGGKGMYGVKVQEAVMAGHEKLAGCTVHYVNEVIDGGAIILQKTITIKDGETPWELGGRVFRAENYLLVEAVALIKLSAEKREKCGT